jgi:hypothetical protein
MNRYTEQIDRDHERYSEIIQWCKVNLKNHLKKGLENVGEIEHILDYLQSEKAPKELRGLQYHAAANNAHRWVQSMNKKGRGIVETESDIETVHDFEDGFKLVKLINKAAFEREGALMSHCVASYHNKGTNVYSLRDGKNNPHCTIEVSGERFQQIKGKGNGSIHPRYVGYVIKILEHFGHTVRPLEMENLGYLKLPDGLFQFLCDNFDGFKYASFDGEQYFYKHSKLIRK